jgi:hypothetical protein
MPKSPSKKDAGQDPSKLPKASAKAKSKSAPAGTNGSKPPAPPKLTKPHRPTPAFPKKNQPPTAAAFAARLPLSLGKRFDQVRSYLVKQRGVSEDVFFYGPESGWALRYLTDNRPLCSLHIHDELPIGIVSLEPAAAAGVDWRALSPAGQKARKQAHGSPALLWLDVELEGGGATDFRSIVRAKLAALSAGDPPAGRSGHGRAGHGSGDD